MTQALVPDVLPLIGRGTGRRFLPRLSGTVDLPFVPRTCPLGARLSEDGLGDNVPMGAGISRSMRFRSSWISPKTSSSSFSPPSGVGDCARMSASSAITSSDETFSSLAFVSN